MRRRKSKLPKAEQLNRDIARWEVKQDAATAMLQKSGRELLKLRRQRQRELAKATRVMTATQVESGPAPVEAFVERGIAAQSAVDVEIEKANDRIAAAQEKRAAEPKADEDWPPFLDRATNGIDKDKAARAEIEAEQAAKKKAKAERAAERRAIKRETIDAELTGQRRKMPLVGKAALAAIARDDRKSTGPRRK